MGSVAESTADKRSSWWMSYTQLIYEMEITTRRELPSTELEAQAFPARKPDTRTFRAP